MKSEDEVDQLIQLKAAEFGILLLRNNSGALKDTTGRIVRYGLGNVSKQHNEKFKSSDRIACVPVKITQEMVGQTIGVFLAVEIKREDWKFKGDAHEKAQQNFMNYITSKGGIAFFANSVESFLDNIKHWIK